LLVNLRLRRGRHERGPTNIAKLEEVAKIKFHPFDEELAQETLYLL
jgi:hypothetical protein